MIIAQISTKKYSNTGRKEPTSFRNKFSAMAYVRKIWRFHLASFSSSLVVNIIENFILSIEFSLIFPKQFLIVIILIELIYESKHIFENMLP